MTSLTSILILGPDTVAAASPATPVQLIHACRRWGFASVVPASWGDELIAANVIRRCTARDNRPVIQCSCPRVSERLASNASMLESSIFWLLSPPVAVARYLRVVEEGRALHITYAGGCPGALDQSIDQHISATELLLAISARGIDLAAQPTVFEDIIPPDRRRHLSSAAGFPDPQQLWEAAAFRIAQPADGDVAVGIAQMLLTDERILIDLSPAMGCICRSSVAAADAPASVLRAPSPVVVDGKVDVSRSAPVPAPMPPRAGIPEIAKHHARDQPPPSAPAASPRQSPARPAFRRQSTWRRQSPRPGVVVARPSGASVELSDRVPLLRRPEMRIIIAALLLASALMIGAWFGRRFASSPTATGAVPVSSAPTMRLARSR